jgi:pyrroline-5-carboxylate reductase
MLTIGLIGCGKMGGALLRGIHHALTSSAEPHAFLLCDAFTAAAESLRSSLSSADIRIVSASDTALHSDLVLLAVKPQDMPPLCAELATVPGSRLFLSIAAGISLESLQTWLGTAQRVIRAMPNTPALVSQGAAAFSRGTAATDADAALATRLLGSIGLVREVPEKLLDAVTGLSGSGPAFVYTVIEALADAGVLMGLPRETALTLAAQTVRGAAAMIVETGKHPAVLRDEVTSPGGTTIAGLEQLELHGLRAALQQAVRAAAERSRELGEK